MKTLRLICCTLALTSPAWSAEEAAPAPLPAERYAAMAGNSPFALATAVAPPEAPQASFAANWYVSGIGRHGDTDFVTIKSRDGSQQFSLFGREPQNGVTVASVEWSETVGKSTVILQKGTETAKLGFNEAELRGPAAGAAPAGAPGAQPGRPQIVPPGANNAVRGAPGIPPVVTPGGTPTTAPVLGQPLPPPGTPQA